MADIYDFRICVIDPEHSIFIFRKIKNRLFPEKKLKSGNFRKMEIVENWRILC